MQPRVPLSRPPPVTLALMATIAALWVASTLLYRFVAWGPALYGALSLHPAEVWQEGRIWQLGSYALLHDLASPGHMLFNAIGLYFFGSELERRWASPRYAFFLVTTALAGGVFATLAAVMGLSSASVVGASAMVMGLVVAWGLTFKNRSVLLFFILPVRGIHLVAMAVAFEVLSALSLAPVSVAAHFGGMAMAALWVSGLWRTNRWRLFGDDLLVRLRLRKAPRLYVVPKPRDSDRFHIH